MMCFFYIHGHPLLSLQPNSTTVKTDSCKLPYLLDTNLQVTEIFRQPLSQWTPNHKRKLLSLSVV